MNSATVAERVDLTDAQCATGAAAASEQRKAEQLCHWGLSRGHGPKFVT